MEPRKQHAKLMFCGVEMQKKKKITKVPHVKDV